MRRLFDLARTHHRRTLLGVASIFSLSACAGGPESVEQCVDRFEHMEIVHSLSADARVEPIFTYDVSEVDNAFKTIIGGPEQMVGVTITATHGSSKAARDAFFKSEVPPKGAFFASDDISLYRVKGTPGPLADTVSSGCRKTPPGARLIDIAWIMVPRDGTN